MSQPNQPPESPRSSRRPLTVGAPGFRAPEPPPPGSPLAAPDSLPPQDSDPAAPSAYASEPNGPDERQEPAGSPNGTPPSSRISSTDRKALERAIAEAIAGAGELANGALTTQDQEDVGLYLTDEQDQERLAAPLARLVARRAGPGMLNPDLSDALAAAVALALYASKQLQRLRALKRARAQGRVPTDHTPEDEAAT